MCIHTYRYIYIFQSFWAEGNIYSEDASRLPSSSSSVTSRFLFHLMTPLRRPPPPPQFPWLHVSTNKNTLPSALSNLLLPLPTSTCRLLSPAPQGIPPFVHLRCVSEHAHRGPAASLPVTQPPRPLMFSCDAKKWNTGNQSV